jgi:hypothetical protein
MSKRFTSGGAGRFTFEDANRILDAADRIEGSQQDPSRSPIRTPRPSIVARLTNPYNSLQFEPESPVRTLMAWDWTEVAVLESAGALLRRSLGFAGGISASDYDNQTRGVAVCIDGQAVSGDIVVLHPVSNAMTYDPWVSERWWAFKGSNKLFSSVPLLISNATLIATRRWKYTVAPQMFDAQGNTAAMMEFPSGIAFNTYETASFGHGQALNFSSPVSSLAVAACQGMVTGTLLSLGATAIYCFEAANPVTPQCS